MTNRIRGASAGPLLLVCLVTLTSAFKLPNRSPDLSSPLVSLGMAAKPAHQRTTLTLADRVAYQRAIEEVYWRHRIWPKERPDPKPSLDEVMSPAQLEKKVEDYLRNSEALEDYWQEPLSVEQLQAEMERMAQHTKQPEVLRELFEALGNDPFVIAECLARPALSERLLRDFYAHDQRFQGELKQRAQADLRAHPTVSQMKRTSGMYSEAEWIKSDSAEIGSTPADTKNIEAVKTNGSEWQESVEKLEGELGNTKSEDAWAQIKTGVLSPLREGEGHYYAVAVMNKGKDRLKLATIAWLKEPLRSWLAKAEGQLPVTMAAVTANYTLPVIANPSDACTNDTWTATSTTNAPNGRYAHTAVWTGSEMIVWGGLDGYFNTGGRYNPSTDSWTATSTTNAPAGRYYHTAVWTGSEMIVWGGTDDTSFFNTGGRYNPVSDSWTATSLTNAPSGREDHTAVWTGSEMIVWGGFSFSGLSNTGGRYNPSTDSWIATSTTNAPSLREAHTAVWTGNEMIVWGGWNDSVFFNTGGRYNPGTDSWTATSVANAPTRRFLHTAVWTGSEMIIWAGELYPTPFNTGGRYNPSTNSWTATSTTNAPADRYFHTAIWTGSEMIVWGGTPDGFSDLNTGGRYKPSTDSWTATGLTNAPSARQEHTAVWTGTEMIVWGGSNRGALNTGGRYCATGPPVVITTPATYIASFAATLNGSLNPHSSTTTVYFEYGLTTSYGFTTPVQTQTGSTVRAISANISGLSASTTYHFRIVAHNGGGTSFGSDRTFTTLSATGPPVAITNPATFIASFSATLNGSVDPHGLTTTVYFQYGTTTSYGSTIASQTKTGNTYQNVAANISGLTASTTYHFRIVAANSAGIRYGADRTFTTLSATGSPVVITNPATFIASFSARLNGTVDPHGLATTVYFQYGTTTSYGLTTPNQSKTGNTYQNVAGNIGGLTASTTYHFRVVGTNSDGTRYGSDSTFTTLSATGAPVVTTNPATNVASSSATLNGSVDPHGLTTTVHFQYGTTTNYGFTTTAQSETGSTYRNVSANISGLSANHIYHFRIVATNSAGTRDGSDRTFTTP